MSELKNKFHPLRHEGVTYHVSFNMNVIDMISDAYGSTEAFINIIRPVEPEEKEDIIVEVEEGAAEIVVPEQASGADPREMMRAYNQLMLAMINDAIEAGDYEADPERTEPVKPYTLRSLQRSLTPSDYDKTSGHLMDIIIAAYPQDDTAENAEKN